MQKRASITLIEGLNRGRTRDLHFGAVVQLDPAAHAHALAGEFFHIEARGAEQFHVCRRDGDGEIAAVIGAEVDIGAVLWSKSRKASGERPPTYSEVSQS